MRLIDADNLVAGIEKLKNSGCFTGNEERILLNTILTVITMSKTIDHVKHGRWEESKCLDDCFWVCSCCKFPSQAVAAPKLYKYCPNCGARMDGEV